MYKSTDTTLIVQAMVLANTIWYTKAGRYIQERIYYLKSVTLTTQRWVLTTGVNQVNSYPPFAFYFTYKHTLSCTVKWEHFMALCDMKVTTNWRCRTLKCSCSLLLKISKCFDYISWSAVGKVHLKKRYQKQCYRWVRCFRFSDWPPFYDII